MRGFHLSIAVGLIAGSIVVSGCVTNIAKPGGPPLPSQERFGSFETVVMVNVQIAPDFASSSANQKAAKKINEELIVGLQNVFTGLKVVDNVTESAEGKTLVIRPLIKEIKFIGGGARFWTGAMAGSSAVMMQVEFVDMASGNVIANPEFYRSASARGGGWSMGASDNMMLSNIVQDITMYAVSNR